MVPPAATRIIKDPSKSDIHHRPKKIRRSLCKRSKHRRSSACLCCPARLRVHVAKVLFTAAGLILEDEPVVSHYLHGKSGRIPKEKRCLYPSSGAVTLLAHKGPVCICNGGGARSREDAGARTARSARAAPPRTAELDRIGAVVSLSHPPSGTHLADSVAELLIKR